MKHWLYIAIFFLFATSCTSRDVLSDLRTGAYISPSIRLPSDGFGGYPREIITRHKKSDLHVEMDHNGHILLNQAPISRKTLQQTIARLPPGTRVFIWADRRCARDLVDSVILDFQLAEIHNLFKMQISSGPVPDLVTGRITTTP